MEELTLSNVVLFLTFLSNVGLGLLVFRKKSPHRRVNTAFSLFTWALAAWALSILMIYLFRASEWRLFWVRMSFVASSNIPSTFLYFSLLFPREKRKLSGVNIALIFLPSMLFTLLSLTTWMVRSVQWETLSGNYGMAYPFFSVYLLCFMSGAILFLMKSYRHSVGLERIQIKYCFLGTFITTLPAVTLNLVLPLLGTSRMSHMGPTTTLIMVSFIAYAMVKHRLMDISIVLKKGTTYVLLIMLLFFPSIFLILFSQRLFFMKIDYLFSTVIFLLLFVVMVSFDKIKTQTEKAVEQLFFKNNYDYRHTLGNFSKALVTILDLHALSKNIIETVTQTLGVEKASLFLLSEEKGAYELLESKNVTFPSSSELLSKKDPLPRTLQQNGEIIIREELFKRGLTEELEKVTRRMALLEAEVSIPLISKGQLIGMMNLSHKFNKDIYSHEDIELLDMLANQTAIAIENARLYDDLKKSKSYIRRAERLASLGTLTAGLAHEIRNPLVAIKTLTQLLPERLDDEEFRNHFVQIASGEVDRISSLVNELLEFARPSEPKLDKEDINSILEGMVLLISTETKKKSIQVVKEYAVDLPPVTVDREQIKQVFLNILLNAIEATLTQGTITLRTRSFVKPGGEPYVQIEVTDTGCGIPEEHLEDIFTPFFTTRNKGSGLGLSISNQIIQDHKGYIEVVSQSNKGASFFVNLPLHTQVPRRRREDFMNDQDQPNPIEPL